MFQKVTATIEKYKMLKNEDAIIVGVSGGPDSLVLLHILNDLKEKYNLRIFAAHVNHNLRGEESDEDQRYVEQICSEWDIPLFIESIDIEKTAREQKITLEEAGREARYGFFNKTLSKVGAQKIAVAHNANDNAETILMRIIRGSGLEGLTGIKPVRDNIIRPLIEVQRFEIEKYCEDNDLKPRIDSSNLKSIYTRNKIRLELIPYLQKEFNENIVETLNRMGMLLNLENEFISDEVNIILNEVIINQSEEYISINLEKIKEHTFAIKSRVLRGIIEKLTGNLQGIEYANIENAINFIEKARSGTQIDLPKGLVVERVYDTLKISKNKKSNEVDKFNYLIPISGKINIIDKKSILESFVAQELKDIRPDKFTQVFDLDKIDGQLILRNRLDGDVLRPKGMSGTKKLKDFFIDLKIPREEREEIPLVALGNEIVWVVGYRTSEAYKVDEGTKNFLILRYTSSNPIEPNI